MKKPQCKDKDCTEQLFFNCELETGYCISCLYYPQRIIKI